jgi:hypothetical protein
MSEINKWLDKLARDYKKEYEEEKARQEMWWRVKNDLTIYVNPEKKDDKKGKET